MLYPAALRLAIVVREAEERARCIARACVAGGGGPGAASPDQPCARMAGDRARDFGLRHRPVVDNDDLQPIDEGLRGQGVEAPT